MTLNGVMTAYFALFKLHVCCFWLLCQQSGAVLAVFKVDTRTLSQDWPCQFQQPSVSICRKMKQRIIVWAVLVEWLVVVISLRRGGSQLVHVDCHFSHLELLHFADNVEWIFVDEADVVRYLVVCNLLITKIHKAIDQPLLIKSLFYYIHRPTGTACQVGQVLQSTSV